MRSSLHITLTSSNKMNNKSAINTPLILIKFVSKISVDAALKLCIMRSSLTQSVKRDTKK